MITNAIPPTKDAIALILLIQKGLNTMLTRVRAKDQDFDPIAFETERERIFQQSQRRYSEFEIDSISEPFGTIYRVWNGRNLIGTFRQNKQKWLAEPFYKNRVYLKLDRDLSKSFDDDKKAVNYIIYCFN